MTWVWLSTPDFTVRVECTPKGIINGGAPLVKRFAGQPFTNLLNWCSSKWGAEVQWCRFDE